MGAKNQEDLQTQTKNNNTPTQKEAEGKEVPQKQTFVGNLINKVKNKINGFLEWRQDKKEAKKAEKLEKGNAQEAFNKEKKGVQPDQDLIGNHLKDNAKQIGATAPDVRSNPKNVANSPPPGGAKKDTKGKGGIGS